MSSQDENTTEVSRFVVEFSTLRTLKVAKKLLNVIPGIVSVVAIKGVPDAASNYSPMLHFKQSKYRSKVKLNGSEDFTEEESFPTRVEVVEDDEKYNLLSSRVRGGDSHTVLLDLDTEVRLMPSKTPGHYHLWLPGNNLSWEEYSRLLFVLLELRIIEHGFYEASIKREASFIRAWPTPSGFENDEPPEGWPQTNKLPSREDGPFGDD